MAFFEDCLEYEVMLLYVITYHFRNESSIVAIEGLTTYLPTYLNFKIEKSAHHYYLSGNVWV